MGKVKEREVVPCDCTIEQLRADYEEAKSKFPDNPICWGLLPWSKTISHMFCKRHHVEEPSKEMRRSIYKFRMHSKSEYESECLTCNRLADETWIAMAAEKRKEFEK